MRKRLSSLAASCVCAILNPMPACHLISHDHTGMTRHDAGVHRGDWSAQERPLVGTREEWRLFIIGASRVRPNCCCCCLLYGVIVAALLNGVLLYNSSVFFTTRFLQGNGDADWESTSKHHWVQWESLFSRGGDQQGEKRMWRLKDKHQALCCYEIYVYFYFYLVSFAQ